MSRLSTDTASVQNGLSTSLAMMVKSACICIAMVVVMFLYSWKLTIYALLLIAPSLCSNRIFMHFYRKYNEQYATAKADNSSIAQEDIGNIRTIKAFSNEKMSIEKYNKSNEEVTRIGAMRSVMWGLFIFGNSVLQKAAFSAILYIIGIVYFAEEMTVGKTMAYLLYMQKLVTVFGEMSNELLAVARV